MLSKFVAKVLRHMFEKDAKYTPIVENVHGRYDIAYQNDRNPYHLLDVYYPNEATTPYPIIFNIHGGAWVACDKNMNRAYSEYLASLGYCVVNMSYRLLPQTDLLGQIQDVSAAIMYVIEQMELPQGNKEQIIFMGDSAGGHIASLQYILAMDENVNRFFCTSMKALPIKALVLQNMLSDMHDITNSSKWYLKAMSTMMFGRNRQANPLYGKASFLELIEDTTHKVPVFLVGSEHDPLYEQTNKMLRYLQHHDWQYDAKIWKKTDRKELGHVFQVNHPLWKESVETHLAITKFLKEVGV